VLVKKLLELSGQCTKSTIDQTVANAQWGKINFEAARVELERTFTLLNQFKRLPIGLLPDAIIGQMILSLQPLQASLEQMRNSSTEQRNAAGARDQLLAQYCRPALGFFETALLYNCLSCLLEGRRSQEVSCPSCPIESHFA
jgi:hypothetical protein